MLRPHKPTGRRGRRAKDKIPVTPWPRCPRRAPVALRQPGSADGAGSARQRAGSAGQGAGSSGTFRRHRFLLRKRRCRESEGPDHGRLPHTCAARPRAQHQSPWAAARTGCLPRQRGQARGGCMARLGSRHRLPGQRKRFHNADAETLCVRAAGRGQREGAAPLCRQQCKGEGAARRPARGSAAASASLLAQNLAESLVTVTPARCTPRAFSHQVPGYKDSTQGEETQEPICQEQRRSLREKRKLNLDLCTRSNTRTAPPSFPSHRGKRLGRRQRAPNIQHTRACLV